MKLLCPPTLAEPITGNILNRGLMATRSSLNHARESSMKKATYRVVMRAADGQLRIRDYDSHEDLLKRHTQIGIDDCSTDLGLRGLPVFRGLIGPIPEGKDVIRYETPEVFETLTKEWGMLKTPRRSRTRRPTTERPTITESP